MSFSSNSLVMTLVNNTDASDLIIPEGRFDRYSIDFAANGITSATLDGTSGLNEFATVTLLPAGFSLEALNPLELDVPLPIDFAQGGMLVELGTGTDLTNTGVTIKVNFE